MSNLTVVVAGIPALSAALQGSGRFSRVESVTSTAGLKSLLQSGTLSTGVGDKVFMFSDTTPVDTTQTLATLLSKLTAMGVPVVIVATSPGARDLVSQCPGAGLLEGPLKLNQVLGALSGLPGMPALEPVANNIPIALPGMTAAPQTASPFASAPFPAAPAAPVFGGAQPVASPFSAAPAGPVAAEQQDAPRRRTLNGLSSQPDEQTSTPFGETVPVQAPSFGETVPVQASPFGETVPVQASPFGQPGVFPAAGGFGQPSPFGQPGAAPAGFGQSAEPAHNGFGGNVSAPGAPAQRIGAPTAPPRPQRRGLVITVTAPKGGTGKSTLSLNLAAYLGLRLRGTGKNVCIVDANVQQADTGKYLNAYTPNIEGILKDVSAIHPDRIHNYLLQKPDLNLSALLGPATPEVANPLYFTGRRYAAILEVLKPNFDYIIIDTPVAELYHDIFREFALPMADFIAVTIAPNVATLMNTDSWLRQITAPRNAEGMGIDREKIGIVLNRAQDGIGLSEQEVRRELGEWRFLGSIPETKEWQRCNNRGELVATRNYHELNEAFSIVLGAATGEELLATTPAGIVPGKGGTKPGLLSRLFAKKA